MKERRKGPLSSIAQEIPPIMKDVAAVRLRSHPEIWTRWEEIAGAELARRLTPVNLNGGVLMVEVSSSSWMQEMVFLKQGLLDKINDVLGYKRLHEIRFRLISSILSNPDDARIATPLRPVVPRPEQLTEAAAEVGDEELRDAILGAVDACLTRRAIE
jgi:hypothetical protein